MMDTAAKDRLARAGDYDAKACGFRARAAIAAAGLIPAAFARQTGQGSTAVNNSLAGRSYPSRETMLALYRQHRIDPTFIFTGDYGHLPGDVQDRLFAALSALDSAPGQSAGSD